MKRFIFLLSLLAVAFNMMAQDAAPEPKEKKSDHYIGLQANFLIRELFNIGGNNNNAIQNPYGFVYHLNSKKSNWGMRLGIGPQLYSITNNSGGSDVKSEGYNMFFRMGVDKRVVITNKWETGVGLDAIMNVSRDRTINENVNFNFSKSDILTESFGVGGGVMGYLRYAIHPKIWLGTEASLYFVSTENKNKLEFTDEFGSIVSKSEDKEKGYNGSLSLPLSMYLLIKF